MGFEQQQSPTGVIVVVDDLPSHSFVSSVNTCERTGYLPSQQSMTESPGRQGMDTPISDLLQVPFFRRRRSPAGVTTITVEDVPLHSFVSCVDACEHCGYQFRDEDDALFHPPRCVKNPANKCGYCGYRFRDDDDAASHLDVCTKRTCGYLPSQWSVTESPDKRSMDTPISDLLQGPFFGQQRSPTGVTIAVEDVPSHSFVSSVDTCEH